MNDKINKGIRKIDKDEKNIMKILSYISKINENKKNMNKLLKQKSTQGRILFDIYNGKVYYIDGCSNNKINVYSNYENLKAKKIDYIIELPHTISVNYSVIHKGYFYYFKYTTNNIIKYDLNDKKILLDKIILPDASLDNQNMWGGYNNINLISDDNNLYAIYASNNNNKRISIALLDENNLNMIKTWNTYSLKKKQCGPIIMIK